MTSRKGIRLTNGKMVYPPRKGQPAAGEWVESARTPTEIVQFVEFRGEFVLVYCYDEVQQVRLLSDNTRELRTILERHEKHIDVRDQALVNAGVMNGALYALIQSGGRIARAVSGAHFDTFIAPKKDKRKSKATNGATRVK